MQTYRDTLLARQRHEEQLRDAMQRQAVRRALEEAGMLAPRAAPPRTMHRLTLLIFWFVGLNALAGAGALLLFPGQTESLFFWTITPPLNAALFGALYLVGGITTSLLARRGEWAAARVLIPVLVAAGLLISAVTLLHHDRFAPGLRLSYWLGVYVGAPLLALLVFWRQERRAADWTPATPLAPAARRLAVGSGIVLLGLGLLLLIRPEPAVAAWPWPITLLLLRIFAAWIAAFGVGLLWFHVEHDWRRLALLPTMLIGAGALDLVVLCVYRSDLTTTGPRLWLYVAHLLGMILIGTALHALQRTHNGSDATKQSSYALLYKGASE
jgi:hypothetical protein